MTTSTSSERELTARELMTRCVITVTPETPIAEAIARMIGQHVSGMPVVDAAGTLVGIVTEGDFLHRPETRTQAPRRRWVELLLGPGFSANVYAHTHGRTVRDVMSTSVVTVREHAPVTDIVRLMDEHRVKRVPVLDAAGRLSGIVSRADLMRALSEYLGRADARETSDDAIRRRIMSEMRRQTWCPLHCIGVDVKDGVVTLNGTIFDERQRHALDVLVANVQGVVRVDDRLSWVEPLSGTWMGPDDVQADGASSGRGP